MAGAGRESVVIVMPSLSETENPHQEVVSALVTGLVIPASPEVANAVHAPGDVMNHEDPDQTAPEEPQECPGPGVGDHAGDHPRNEQSDHGPEEKKPIDGDDAGVSEQVRGVALRIGPRGVRVEKPSHVGMEKSLDGSQDTGLPAYVGGMGIHFLVGVAVMPPMGGNPPDEVTLHRHAAKNSQRVDDGRVGLESSVGKRR